MPRTAIPFVPQLYDAGAGTVRMSELARRRANEQADLILRQGDISANLGQQLAGIAGNVAGSIAQYKADEPKRKAAQAEGARLKGIDQALRESIDPETGRIDFQTAAQRVTPIDPMTALELWDKADSAQKQAVIKASDLAGEAAQKAGSLLLRYEKMSPPEAQAEYDQLRGWAQQQRLPEADQMPEAFNAPFLRKALFSVMTADQIRSHIMGAEKPAEGFTLSEGQTRFGPDGKPLANVAKPAPPPESYTLSPGSQRFGPDGTVIARVPAAPREPKEEPFRNPIAVIDPKTGKPVLMDPRKAEGLAPASTREQGRAVTSGDAGRIAELTTSLDDLDKLTQQLGETGAESKIGAMLPNVVTEFTGWGQDAKQRQAVINRVKQVIGKALEGGVLRKEDEAKYEKILPTIGDDPDVARTKLNGLRAALVQRRERFIESLTDAGYATDTFTQRVGTPAAPTAPAAQRNPFRK